MWCNLNIVELRDYFLKHTFVIGGAKSGKSGFALNLAEKYLVKPHSQGLFIATATVTDDEMAQRIERHKKERHGHWITVEEPLEVARVIRDVGHGYAVILLDCLTLWVSNVLFMDKDSFETRCAELCAAIKGADCPVVVVANEVGLGIVPMDPVSRQFRDMAGVLNQRMATCCDEVYFVVAGLPMPIKTFAQSG